MKRWLYLAHRWLGIALVAVMGLWFLSGLVMLYVGYPKLSLDEQLAGLPPLPATGCCVPLDQALAAAGLPASAAPTTPWRLTSVAGVPRYVFGPGAGRGADRGPLRAVDAQTGRPVAVVAGADALAAARHFAQGAPARLIDRVHEDAWTHSRALDAHRPLWRVAVDDAPGRWLYVSSRSGEVVRDATRTERSWGWLGAWLHWLYPLRGGLLDRWWADAVIGLALAGSALAASGLVLGLWRWRFRRPYRHGRRTPYPGRAARWHHRLGLAGGALCLTWVLSGLLSMNPWQLFDSGARPPDRLAYAGGPLRAGDALPAARVLQQLDAAGLRAHQLQWQRVGGVPQVLAQWPGGSRLLTADQGLTDALPPARWQAAAERLLPGARIVARERLDAYDAHYYARAPHTMGGHRERPLPAWRLRFDDDQATSVVIDPRSGAIVQVQDRLQRVDRWAFAFLHSFDLPVLLAARPAWDAWMLGFGLAGLGLCATAGVTGWRRLRRRAPARPRPDQPAQAHRPAGRRAIADTARLPASPSEGLRP